MKTCAALVKYNIDSRCNSIQGHKNINNVPGRASLDNTGEAIEVKAEFKNGKKIITHQVALTTG
jgi:hypothetical protein